MNKPRAPRVVVKAPVSFEGKLGVGRGTTFNLSLGGCGLESSADVNMDATIKLHLLIPTEMKPVKVDRAKVIWTAGKDCGIEFVNMESTSRLRLQHYIEGLQQKTLTQPRPDRAGEASQSPDGGSSLNVGHTQGGSP